MIRALRRYPLVTDVCIAAVFLLPQFADQLTGGPGLFSAVALVIFTIALALRRARPAIALGVAWAGGVVQMVALAPAPLFYDVAVLAVLFTSAAYGGRVLRAVGLASAVAGSVVATGYLVLLNGGAAALANTLASGRFPSLDSIPSVIARALFPFFGCLAALGLSWTLGLLARAVRRSRESREAQEEAEEVVAVEQERNRIARDMHDVVAHSLAVVIAQADGARYARASDPSAVDDALSAISSTSREALADVRILLSQLRHSEGETPQPTLADLERLLDQLRSSGLVIIRSETGVAESLAAGQQLAVYRVVQEALTNVLRHGDTTEPARLNFGWDPDGLTVTVASAIRAEVRVPPTPAGHGLAGMRERATLAGGTFAAVQDGDQYVVTARLPILLKAALS